MPTVKELEAQVAALSEQLAYLTQQLGIPAPRTIAERPEDRADYIEFGSPEHAAFLGLVEIETDGLEKSKEDGWIIYQSAKSDRYFRLEDQVTGYITYPDPAQVARLVLQQKVGSLESGKPPIPSYAPSLWVPVDQPL